VAADYPLGHTNGAPGLLPQLEWAADALNHGFYGWQDRGETAIRFEDGTLARGAPGLNPGTVAVQRALAADATYSQLPQRLAEFDAAYRKLFGDPMPRWMQAQCCRPGWSSRALHLPWLPGEWWHLTGGPHGGWMPSSGWAALDFVPETAQIGNCVPAPAWAVAAAPGVVVRSTPGEILLDLDGDGDMRTGWVLQYLHIVDQPELGDGVGPGRSRGPAQLRGGARPIPPICTSRGATTACGWMPAARRPMVLDGWTAFGGFEYEGGHDAARPVDRAEATHSRDRGGQRAVAGGLAYAMELARMSPDQVRLIAGKLG
jgi:LasA protease